MKVLLINGSYRVEGCTYTALAEVAKPIQDAGMETEIFHVGTEPIRGCTACGHCKRTGSGRCVYDDDTVNTGLEKAEGADAYVFGSPVHYAAASGMITSFLDRFFFASKAHAYKPGACIVTCRRGGATAAFEQLNKYFTISNMPVVPSQYWNMVHGNTPEEIAQDQEGLQIMRTLGRNMVWLLECLAAGQKAGIPWPEHEPRVSTNFIR